jgi:hypothetical protein
MLQTRPLLAVDDMKDKTITRSTRKPYRKDCRSVLPYRINEHRSCADPEINRMASVIEHDDL